jgi:hypothetical protein
VIEFVKVLNEILSEHIVVLRCVIVRECLCWFTVGLALGLAIMWRS